MTASEITAKLAEIEKLTVEEQISALEELVVQLEKQLN
jgi:hypothetical protein